MHQAFYVAAALAMGLLFIGSWSNLRQASKDGRVVGDFWYTFWNLFAGLALVTWVGLLAGWFPRDFIALPTWVQWSGVVLAWSSWGMMAAARAKLGRAFQITLVRPTGAQHITDGWYHTLRHPFYIGMVLLVASGFLVTGSLRMLWTAFALAVFLTRLAYRENKVLA